MERKTSPAVRRRSIGRSCFNGAAPMMERKTPVSTRSRLRRQTALQWGRSDDGAENPEPMLPVARDRLQWGRSDDGAENRALSSTGMSCFNGAAPMMERKTWTRGDDLEADDLRLQWGRSDDGAENRPRDRDHGPAGSGFNGAAPMMERKTRIAAVAARAGAMLQWGRSDDGAENAYVRATQETDMTLQWGRSDDGAENARPAASTPADRSFNGAAPMMERKTGSRRGSARSAQIAASMGPLR